MTPDAISGIELYREWYLSITWNALLGFVLPYAIMVRPIRSRVRFLYLGHRCFDRPEDRPYTLIWFISQMIAVGVIMLPMTQYFVSKGMWSLYLIAAMSNGLGDGLAEPVGKIWGKRKYKVNALFTGREYTRSYAGSACVAFFTALGVIINYDVLTTSQLTLLLLILPPLMTVIEAKSPHTWDNFLLYIACWLVLYLVVFA
jgi:phytol kinase